MKRYRVRKYGPLYWIMTIGGILAWVLAMNLPSTLENILF